MNVVGNLSLLILKDDNQLFNTIYCRAVLVIFESKVYSWGSRRSPFLWDNLKSHTFFFFFTFCWLMILWASERVSIKCKALTLSMKFFLACRQRQSPLLAPLAFSLFSNCVQLLLVRHSTNQEEIWLKFGNGSIHFHVISGETNKKNWRVYKKLIVMVKREREFILFIHSNKLGLMIITISGKRTYTEETKC